MVAGTLYSCSLCPRNDPTIVQNVNQIESLEEREINVNSKCLPTWLCIEIAGFLRNMKVELSPRFPGVEPGQSTDAVDFYIEHTFNGVCITVATILVLVVRVIVPLIDGKTTQEIVLRLRDGRRQQ